MELQKNNELLQNNMEQLQQPKNNEAIYNLTKSFCVDAVLKMGDENIKFAKLQNDKGYNAFYNAKYDSDNINEYMFPYYGAKESDKSSTFGGFLPLMNEFFTSTVINTISNLREEKLVIAPRVLLNIEDNKFRLLSKMVEDFHPIESFKDIEQKIGDKNCKAASGFYLAGLSIAIQEADLNLKNYGTAKVDKSDQRIFAKIDSNILYNKDDGKSGIRFNYLKRPKFQEVLNMESLDTIGFGSYVAAKGVFNSMNEEDSPDYLRFVGHGCLEVKKDCSENFKNFMLGVKDFVDMPDDFIKFLNQKIYKDIASKNEDLAKAELKNIDKSTEQFLALKSRVAIYFKNELELFKKMFPVEAEKNQWDSIMYSLNIGLKKEEKIPDSSINIISGSKVSNITTSKEI